MYKLTFEGKSYGCYSQGCAALTLALLLGERRAPMASEDVLLAEASDTIREGRATVIEADKNDETILSQLLIVSSSIAKAIADRDFENRVSADELPPASPHYQTTTAEKMTHGANYEPSIKAVNTPPVPGELRDAETSPERETTEADVENAAKEAGVPAERIVPSGDIDEVFEEEFETEGEPLPPDTPPEGKLMASHNRKGKRRS